MDRGKFIICMVSVLSLGIGGDCRSVDAESSQNTIGSTASYEKVWSTKLPHESTCGRSNVSHDRIVGGKASELGAWPWMAALGYRDINWPKMLVNYYQWNCGGSLISDRYVLTAAHCIDIEKKILVVVRLGDLNLNPNVIDKADPIDVNISLSIKHEHFDKSRGKNDIALLKLQHSVTFNSLIQPICLPISPKHINNKFVNTEPTVAGWGFTMYQTIPGLNITIEETTTALREVDIPVVDNAACQQSYAEKNINIDDKQLCAGRMGKSSCLGDSGGPLMWPSGKQYYTIGVVSFGHMCGAPGYPIIYARVTSYLEWISNRMDNS